MKESPLTHPEALRLFVAGELVTVQDMEARTEEDGRYILREAELLDPESYVREGGLPVVEVEGMEGTFFRLAHVLSFMEEWLRIPPEEEAAMERERLEEEREKEERLAKMRWEFEHPKPKILAGALRIACGSSLDQIQRGLRNRSKTVRTAAREEALNLLAGLAKTMAGRN